MVNYWYVLLVRRWSPAIWGFVLMLRTDWGRLWWDKVKLTVPLFKKMFRALYISRSLHTMGQLINAGVPMLDTIAITADISGNTLYKRMWRAVYGAVKQGKKISAPLQKSPLLPRAVVQMISAGEESGKLGEVLDEVSRVLRPRAQERHQERHRDDRAAHDRASWAAWSASSRCRIILPIFKLSSLVK